VANVVIDLTVAVWFFRRIDKPPIRQRYPQMSLTIAMANMVSTTLLELQNVVGVYPQTCFALNVVIVAALAVIDASNLMRTLAYCWEARISQRKLHLALKSDGQERNSRMEDLESEQNFLKHIKYSKASVKYFLLANLFQAALLVGVYTISSISVSPSVSILFQSRVEDAICGSFNVLEHIFALVFFSIEQFVMLYFIFRYGSRFSDNFYLRRELLMQAFVLLTFQVYSSLLTQEEFLIKYKLGSFDYAGLFMIFANYFIVFITLIEPIRLSYLAEFSSGGEIRKTAADLETVKKVDNQKIIFLELLNDRKGFLSFSKFLRAEFSLEHLLFWKEVVNFRVNFESLKDPIDAASDLFSTYISDEAPMQVNLPAHVFQPLRDAFSKEEISPTDLESLRNVFVNSEEEILLLMLHDSFTRFKIKQEYAAIQERLEFNEARSSVLHCMLSKICCCLKNEKELKYSKKLLLKDSEETPSLTYQSKGLNNSLLNSKGTTSELHPILEERKSKDERSISIQMSQGPVLSKASNTADSKLSLSTGHP
jgi:hypothetical protein